jgi:hypothetical protein
MIRELISFLILLIRFLINVSGKKPIKNNNQEKKENIKEKEKSIVAEPIEVKEETVENTPKNKVPEQTINPELLDKTKTSKELLDILIEDEQDEKMRELLLRLKGHMNN